MRGRGSFLSKQSQSSNVQSVLVQSLTVPATYRIILIEDTQIQHFVSSGKLDWLKAGMKRKVVSRKCHGSWLVIGDRQKTSRNLNVLRAPAIYFTRQLSRCPGSPSHDTAVDSTV